MRIQNLSTASNYSLTSGYVELNVINFTNDSYPQLGAGYQTEDIYLIADNCPAFDNIPIYIEVVMWNYTGGYIYNIRNANTDAVLNRNDLVNCDTEFLNGVDLIPFTGLPENDNNNNNNMAELDEPTFMSADDPVRPPDDPTIRPPDGSLDTGGIRPPTGSDGVTDYGDAASVIAALAATDTEYASLIQNTISLIQELQAEIEAGTTNDAQAEATINELEAQLEELIGTQGAVNLLLGAIDSAAAGTFGDGSGVTFCSYQAPPPPNPDEDPNTGILNPQRNIQNRGTDVIAGDELQNPFTSAVVNDVCDKLAALSDAVNFQNAFEAAGFNDFQDLINALADENSEGYSDGFDAGAASIDQQALIDEGYSQGYADAQEAIKGDFTDYATTLAAYQGGEAAGFQDAINQLNSASYGGNAVAAVQNLYDAIYELGASSITPEDGITQEDVDNAQIDGYSDGFDDGVASVQFTDFDEAIVDPTPDGLSNYYAQSAQAAYDFGYSHGYSAGNSAGQTSGASGALTSINALIGELSDGTPASYNSINDAAIAIYNLGAASVDPASGISFTNPETGVVTTGADAVDAAEAYGYTDGFAEGAASVTPEDGVSQADVDAAVDAANNAAQEVINDLIAQINTANDSNVAYGEFIQSLTSELDILETFLTSYYGYDPNSDENMFTIPNNVSNDAGYQQYFSGGQEYKVFDPRRIVNMNEYINFSGKMQSRTSAPVERDNDLELELTPTAKTGLYILGGGALAFLALKLFKKK